jgi:hypothetical protein
MSSPDEREQLARLAALPDAAIDVADIPEAPDENWIGHTMSRTSADLIADLVRRHLAGTPLAIEHPNGGQRVIAEIYPTDRGFVFADIGWVDPLQSGHPFHVITG